MKRFDLSEYRGTKQYFLLFDILIKDEVYNKDDFLNSIGIAPNTYRRCRANEQKKGKELIEILANHFNLKVPTDRDIDELEDFINKVYYDLYYKIFDNIEKYKEKITYYRDNRYLFYPITNMFDILFYINRKSSARKYRDYLPYEYFEIKKLSSYYNESITKIYKILYFRFDKEVDETTLVENDDDGYIYYMMSFRCADLNKYIECLYYSEKAKEILIRENNFKRIVYLNFNIMYSLNALKKHQMCFDMAEKQILSIQSLSDMEYERKTTQSHLVVAALGLRKYQRIIDELNKELYIPLTQAACYLVAKAQLSMDDYIDYFTNKVSLDLMKKDEAEFLSTLNSFITTGDKKILNDLYKFDFNHEVINILKKL